VSRTVTVLVLLPGMDGSGRFFTDFVAALGEAITPLVIAYPSDQLLGYAGLTDFVRARLPSDTPFFLLGESFSSPIAIALAAERPPMLGGLILSCGFARNPIPPMRLVRSLVRLAPLHSRIAVLAAPLLLGWGATASLRQTLRRVLDTAPVAVLRHRMREVLDLDYSERVSRVAVPVLYLQAARDRIVFPGSARRIGRLLPALRLVVLRGPHLLLQTRPAETAAAVCDFIAATRRAC
jgi:pimeloyl-[acyl-carrier protein] methyl ester esterase